MNEYYCNKETEKLEFKQFCVNNNVELNELKDEEIIEIIKTGVWTHNFSMIINHDIYHYIKTIIPKYLCGFINANINGKLVIGVNDNGFITGIPCDTYISKKKIYSVINDAICQNIKTNNYVNNILNNIKIDIIKLKTYINVLNDDAKELYDNYVKVMKKYNNDMLIYQKKYDIWINSMNIYRTKLITIANTTELRNQLCDYIISKKNSKLFNHTPLIKLLKSDEYINLTTDYIVKYKNNKNYIVYWVIDFKNFMLSINNPLYKNKPIKPNKPSILHINYILSLLYPMMYRFVKNNINYYIIEISIINKKYLKNDMMYKTQYNNKWLYKKRCVFNSNPCVSVI